MKHEAFCMLYVVYLLLFVFFVFCLWESNFYVQIYFFKFTHFIQQYYDKDFYMFHGESFLWWKCTVYNIVDINIQKYEYIKVYISVLYFTVIFCYVENYYTIYALTRMQKIRCKLYRILSIICIRFLKLNHNSCFKVLIVETLTMVCNIK